MLGTDGVNVSDQHKYNDPSSDRKPIDTMVDMLETSHMAPTAPDTLEVVPSESVCSWPPATAQANANMSDWSNVV